MNQTAKSCPYLFSGRTFNAYCMKDQCMLWCKESIGYRAGCGLMPKENRSVPVPSVSGVVM